MPVLRTIVVAVDFSETSNDAAKAAAALARDEGATLHVLHVVPDVRQRFGTVESADRTVDALQREWQDSAAQRLAALGGDVAAVVRKAIVGAHTAETIAHYAADVDADLIVVGTHGYGPIRRWLLGSVSDRLIRLASRPVMTVPPRTLRPASAQTASASHAGA